MKSFYSTILIVLLGFALTSCQEKEEEIPFTLPNTIWTISTDASTTQAYLRFSDGGGNALFHVGNSSTVIKYLFEFDEPNLTLYPEDETFAMLTGTINGNFLTITNTAKEKVVGTFTKVEAVPLNMTNDPAIINKQLVSLKNPTTYAVVNNLRQSLNSLVYHIIKLQIIEYDSTNQRLASYDDFGDFAYGEQTRTIVAHDDVNYVYFIWEWAGLDANGNISHPGRTEKGQVTLTQGCFNPLKVYFSLFN